MSFWTNEAHWMSWTDLHDDSYCIFKFCVLCAKYSFLTVNFSFGWSDLSLASLAQQTSSVASPKSWEIPGTIWRANTGIFRLIFARACKFRSNRSQCHHATHSTSKQERIPRKKIHLKTPMLIRITLITLESHIFARLPPQQRDWYMIHQPSRKCTMKLWKDIANICSIHLHQIRIYTKVKLTQYCTLGNLSKWKLITILESTNQFKLIILKCIMGLYNLYICNMISYFKKLDNNNLKNNAMLYFWRNELVFMLHLVKML